MTFFYDLNKKLDSIREKPEVTHKQLNERDEGKPGKNFAKIAKDAGERYGSKAAGERVAGAVRNKLKAQGKLEEQQVDEISDELANRAAQGRRDQFDAAKKKSLAAINAERNTVGGSEAEKSARWDKARDLNNATNQAGVKMGQNMQLQKSRLARQSNAAVAEGGSYLNYADSHDENVRAGKKPAAPTAPKPQGVMDKMKSVGKKVASGVNKLVGHGSDEDMIKDLQRKSGAPVTGKKPEQRSMREAAGPLDFDKVLDAIAALYGDDIWDNDAMQDLANDLEQAGPTDKELDFIIAKGRLPKRLAGIQFSAGDDVQFGESSAPMTAKQKSFAKLAPPADKITFADKIAGAKKEVDEMLGDVAAEAMRKALGGGKGRNAEMDEDNAFDYKSPRADAPKVGSVERGHKHDIKHTATGRVVTRRTDDQGISVGGETDDEGNKKEKRTKAGRPEGSKNVSSKAKGPTGKSKLITKESDVSTGNLQQMYNQLLVLKSHVQDPDGQASLKELISMVKHYMNQGGEQALDEKAVSKKQQKFMGMVHAAQKGEKPASKEVAKVAKTMKKKDAEDFASTKHKGLPEKVKSKKKKEEEVEESSTTSGAVAPSTATGGSKGGVFGKGIYDSMNRELEKMIAESMSVNMSDSTEGGKSLTITATDEDALKLGMLLKNAGLGGGEEMHSHGEEPCETCGSTDCGCGDVQEAVDENAPDWPTNTETSNDALQYAGGLNKPKSSGMATIPVTDVSVDGEDMFSKPVHENDLRRMMEMAGIKQAELEPWKETMKEGDLDEVYVVNPRHPSVGSGGEDEEERLTKAWDDEVALYHADNPADDPQGILRRRGFNRAQDVGQRLALKLQKLKNYPELREPGLGVGESLEESEECSTCHADPCKCESVEESIRRMREMAGIKEAKKPDYLDFDKDGDKEEPMTKAIKDKEEKKVEESIFALTNQWKAYRG